MINYASATCTLWISGGLQGKGPNKQHKYSHSSWPRHSLLMRFVNLFPNKDCRALLDHQNSGPRLYSKEINSSSYKVMHLRTRLVFAMRETHEPPGEDASMTPQSLGHPWDKLQTRPPEPKAPTEMNIYKSGNERFPSALTALKLSVITLAWAKKYELADTQSLGEWWRSYVLF